jgi:hypothetical protein
MNIKDVLCLGVPLDKTARRTTHLFSIPIEWVPGV